MSTTGTTPPFLLWPQALARELREAREQLKVSASREAELAAALGRAKSANEGLAAQNKALYGTLDETLVAAEHVRAWAGVGANTGALGPTAPSWRVSSQSDDTHHPPCTGRQRTAAAAGRAHGAAGVWKAAHCAARRYVFVHATCRGRRILSTTSMIPACYFRRHTRRYSLTIRSCRRSLDCGRGRCLR